jgi:hypothetical protein
MTKFKPLPPLNRLEEVFEIDSEGRLYWKSKPHPALNVSRIKPGDQVTRKSNGYFIVGLDGHMYFAHRIVWALLYKQDPGVFQVDHVNGDRADNRSCNLRLCDNGQNQLNAKIHSNNTSGIKGVFLAPSRKARPWVAEYRGRRLGYFATKEEAAKAVSSAVEKCDDRQFYSARH